MHDVSILEIEEFSEDLKSIRDIVEVVFKFNVVRIRFFAALQQLRSWLRE